MTMAHPAAASARSTARRTRADAARVLLVAVLALATGGPARALDLDETVRRAAELDPRAVVASLAEEAARADSLAAWSEVGLTPRLATRWEQGQVTGRDPTIRASLGLLDPSAWAQARLGGAYAGRAGTIAAATALDAQYAAAALYVEAIAAEDAARLATELERVAVTTRDATRTRVKAGVDDELAARSAEVAALEAQARTARAQATRAAARARLARVLQRELPDTEPLAPTDLTTASGSGPRPNADREGGAPSAPSSPWEAVARADLSVASAEVGTAWTEMLPSADLRAEKALDLDNLPDPGWQVSLRATWKLPGVVGGFAHVRARQLERRIAEVQLEGLQRDLDRDRAVVRADLAASAAEVELGRARESLAASALQLAQTRLTAGVADPLDVLRLQDDLARAQRTRVEAERSLALAHLELRRLNGTPW